MPVECPEYPGGGGGGLRGAWKEKNGVRGSHWREGVQNRSNPSIKAALMPSAGSLLFIAVGDSVLFTFP